jgi:hypothetical protein
MKKMGIWAVLVLIAGAAVLSGCVGQQPTTTSTVAPRPSATATPTATPTLPAPTQTQTTKIDLSATITSASIGSQYIVEPILILTNAGSSAVSNIVIDVELYRGGKLIVSQAGVLYVSGTSNFIESVPAGESTKGWLNLHIYKDNTNDFTPGTYLLRVIIRKGASAVPIATAEKTVEVT